MQQKLAFLDSINPLLRNILKQQLQLELQKLTEESIDKIDSYMLLFYTSAELKLIDNARTNRAVNVIRRRALAATAEIVDIDTNTEKQLKSYHNLYVQYLNLKSYQSFEKYVEENFNRSGDNLLVRLLTISKRAHYYGLVGDDNLLKTDNIYDYVRKTIVLLNREFPQYSPVWLYSFLHSLLTKNEALNSLAEYEKLFQEIGITNGMLRSFYLLLFKPDTDYRKFKEIFFTIDTPYRAHIDNFLAVLHGFFIDNKTVYDGSEQVELLELHRDVRQLAHFLKSYDHDGSLRYRYLNKKSDIVLRKAKLRLKDSLYSATEEELHTYIDNPLLNDVQKKLFSVTIQTKDDALEMFQLSLENVPALSPKFLKTLLESSDDHKTILNIVDSIKNTGLRQNLKDIFLKTSDDMDVICHIISDRDEMSRCALIVEVSKRRKPSRAESVRLISLLSRESLIVEFLSTGFNSIEDAYSVAKELNVEKNFINKNIFNVSENTAIFSEDFLLDVALHLLSNKNQLAALFKAIYRDRKDVGIFIANIMFEAILQKKNQGDIMDLYSQYAVQHLTDDELQECADHFITRALDAAKVPYDSENSFEELIFAYKKYESIICRTSIYLEITDIIFGDPEDANEDMQESMIDKLNKRKSFRELAWIVDIYSNLGSNGTMRNNMNYFIDKYFMKPPFYGQSQHYPEFNRYILSAKALLSIICAGIALSIDKPLIGGYLVGLKNMNEHVMPTDIYSLTLKPLLPYLAIRLHFLNMISSLNEKHPINGTHKKIADAVFPFTLQAYEYLLDELLIAQTSTTEIKHHLLEEAENLDNLRNFIQRYFYENSGLPQGALSQYISTKYRYLQLHFNFLNTGESEEKIAINTLKALVDIADMDKTDLEKLFSEHMEDIEKVLLVSKTPCRKNIPSTLSMLFTNSIYTMVQAAVTLNNRELAHRLHDILISDQAYLDAINRKDPNAINELLKVKTSESLELSHFLADVQAVSLAGTSTSTAAASNTVNISKKEKKKKIARTRR